MGERTNGRLLNVLGWTTTAVTGLAAGGLIVTAILGFKQGRDAKAQVLC
jgi:hypothetical protein